MPRLCTAAVYFVRTAVGAVALLGADMAMYEAKSTGRDRVIAAESFAVSTRHEKWRGVARRREEAIAEPTFLQAAPGLARKRCVATLLSVASSHLYPLRCYDPTG